MCAMDNQQNSERVLFDLIGTIQNFSDTFHRYLNQIGEREVLNPFQKSDFLGSIEPVPCEFLERFGVHRMVFNVVPGRLGMTDQYQNDHDNKSRSSGHWNNVKNDEIIEELKTLFRSCAIVQFADWASVNNGSDFWDGLLSDVIRTCNKKDFQFIFYLGDPAKKFLFETDEILDLISAYSSYGKVTLVLDENESDKLWNILNGRDPGSPPTRNNPPGAMENYWSIFNSMNIDALVIFCANCTVLLSREYRFEFAGRSLNNVKVANCVRVRDCFNAGYQLGLLLQLKVPHCVALGLAISGTYPEHESEPEQKALLQYIKKWIAELNSTEKIVQNAWLQKING